MFQPEEPKKAKKDKTAPRPAESKPEKPRVTPSPFMRELRDRDRGGETVRPNSNVSRSRFMQN